MATLVGALSRVLDGAAGEAGKQAWESLTNLIGRVFGRRSTADEAARTLDERPAPEAIEALAETLAAEAHRDPDLAAQLRQWLATAERAVGGDVTDNVNNTVAGDVHGPVVQARDIHGDIRFG